MKISSAVIPICMGIVAVCCLAGCPYSTSSSLPEHIRTIDVAMFRNKSLYKGLETRLTSGIKSKMQNENQVVVVNRDGNATISGEIISVTKSVTRETKTDRPASVRIDIKANFSFYDNVEKRYIYENLEISSAQSSAISGVYDSDRGEEQSTAEQAAVDQLAKDIVRKTIAKW